MPIPVKKRTHGQISLIMGKCPKKGSQANNLLENGRCELRAAEESKRLIEDMSEVGMENS